MNESDDFIVTKEYRRFAEFCDACRRERYIGLCYGPPGVGKTLSARRYARWEYLEPFIQRFFRDPETRPPVDFSACRTAIYTPSVATSPRQIESGVKELCTHLACAAAEVVNHVDDLGLCREWVELLVVDEADRLNVSGLEQMRDIYDRLGIGLVLVGMPGIEKRLSRYPQLYSRVGFVHRFRTLSHEEVRFILKNKWASLGRALNPEDFTDEETIAGIIRITGGNFRLIDRLLSQVERVLQINELKTVTKEVVEAARENLVIGAAA